MTDAEQASTALTRTWAMCPSVADTVRLAPDAAAGILDRRARILLCMTGPEFTDAYRAGTLPADAPDAVVERLARLLPAETREPEKT